MDSPRGSAFRSLAAMTPTGGEFLAVGCLALPVVAVQVGMITMGLVDTVMVGHFSARDLAAVALGNLYFFTAVVFPMGVIMSLDPLVSQAVGAGDEPGVARAFQRGAFLALLLGLPAAAVLIPGGTFLTLLGQPPEVVPVAAGYARATIPGLFPFLIFIVLRQTLQAMGRVAPIVVAIVLANLANLFFNWLFIYGHLGIPAMGAVGSGWASSLARWLLLLGLAFFAWPLVGPYARPLRADAFQRQPLQRMLRLGAPIGVQFALEFGAFGAVGVLMGWLGTLAMAGHQVALNLASTTFMVPLGISQASAVLVGQGVGRGDPIGARRAAGAGISLGVAFMGLAAMGFLLFPHPLARGFSDEAAVIAVAAALIPLAGLFQVFDGLQVVASGVLRGVGDTRSPMVVNLIGFWILGIPVSAWLGFRTPAGPVGLWWGLVVGLGVVALVLLWRVSRRLGADLRRIDLEEPERSAS